MCYNIFASKEGKEMKKYAMICVLVLGLCLTTAGMVSAEGDDAAKNKTITEIGTLVNSQKYQIALTKCNSAIQKYPDEAFLYYWRASIENSTGDKHKAIEDLNKSIELNPSNPRAYVLRGICKSELEDREGALEDYNKAIELNPKDSSAYSMRACVKLDMGDFDGANADLDISNKLMNSKTEK